MLNKKSVDDINVKGKSCLLYTSSHPRAKRASARQEARSQMHLAPRKKKSISQLAVQSLITGH